MISNRVISNVASIMAGAKAAGIYTTNSAESCLFISNHCKVVFFTPHYLFQS